MPNKTKKTIVAEVVEKTGAKPGQAKQALETVLGAIKRALANGNKVELEKLGKLKVISRNPIRRINQNLKNRASTIETMNKKHPKTVRLLGGKDLSENPQRTIVHERPQPPVEAKRSFAVAFPSWRRRIR